MHYKCVCIQKFSCEDEPIIRRQSICFIIKYSYWTLFAIFFCYFFRPNKSSLLFAHKQTLAVKPVSKQNNTDNDYVFSVVFNRSKKRNMCVKISKMMSNKSFAIVQNALWGNWIVHTMCNSYNKIRNENFADVIFE